MALVQPCSTVVQQRGAVQQYPYDGTMRVLVRTVLKSNTHTSSVSAVATAPSPKAAAPSPTRPPVTTHTGTHAPPSPPVRIVVVVLAWHDRAAGCGRFPPARAPPPPAPPWIAIHLPRTIAPPRGARSSIIHKSSHRDPSPNPPCKNTDEQPVVGLVLRMRHDVSRRAHVSRNRGAAGYCTEVIDGQFRPPSMGGRGGRWGGGVRVCGGGSF